MTLLAHPPGWLAPACVGGGVIARWWALGADTLTRDELYTGAVSGLPLSRIVGYVAAHDDHPPIDFLLRHVFAGAQSAGPLRAPSAVFASAFLVLLWWWVRDRGWFGVVAVATAAANPYLVFHGRQARFYSLMLLLGLVAAFAVDRWLHDRRRRWSILLGATALIALLTHFSGLFMVPGLVALAAARRDRSAWELRGAVGAAVAVWWLLWGPAFVDQRAMNLTGWMPLSSVDTVSVELGRLMSPFHSEVGMAAVGVAGVGIWRLWRGDRRLGPVAVWLGATPIVLVVIVGLREHILAARSFSVAAWSLPLGVAAAAEVVGRRSRVGAMVLCASVGAAMAWSLPSVYSWEEEATVASREMARLVQPGDGVVAPTPDEGFVFAWTVGTPFGEPDDARLGVPAGHYAQVVPGADFSGRVWSYHPAGRGVPVPGSMACAADGGGADPTWRGETMVLECVAIRPSSR